jgi:hypothetical protein
MGDWRECCARRPVRAVQADRDAGRLFVARYVNASTQFAPFAFRRRLKSVLIRSGLWIMRGILVKNCNKVKETIFLTPHRGAALTEVELKRNVAAGELIRGELDALVGVQSSPNGRLNGHQRE